MSSTILPPRPAIHANIGSGRQMAHTGQGSQNVNESSGTFINHPAYNDQYTYNIYCCFFCTFSPRPTGYRRYGRNEDTQRTRPVPQFRSLELVSRRTQTDINPSALCASAAAHSSLPSTEVLSLRGRYAQDEASILNFLKAWLPDLDRRDADGCTALHDAVKSGLRLVVRHSFENDTLALDLGRSININLAHLLNVKDNKGLTPMHHAAMLDKFSLLYLLAEKGADLEATDKRGRTVLHIAAIQGQLSTVKYLLQKGEDLLQKGVWLQARDNRGLTSLHLAAMKGHDEVVRALLAGGAQWGYAGLRMIQDDLYSRTPLHLAVRMSHVEIVKALIEELGNAGRATASGNEHINISDFQGRTALHAACITPTQIPTHGNTDDDVRRVSADMVSILVEAGAALDVRDAMGCTPLMYAAQRANVRAVECLVRKGADVGVRDGRGSEVGSREGGRNARDYAEDDAPRGTERNEVMRILDLSLVGRRNTF